MGYSQELIDYFLEIALGGKKDPTNAQIHKWYQDIMLQIQGSPTSEDNSTLKHAIDEINQQLNGASIILTNQDPNAIMYFVPQRNFSSIEPHYQPPATAFFWTNWNTQSALFVNILISSETPQQKRSHQICAMLLRIIGLANKSNKDPASVLFSGENTTTEYSEKDLFLINLLYNPIIEQNMTAADVQRVLSQVNFADEDTSMPSQSTNGQNTLFCYSCGEPRSQNEKFCKYCGVSFEKKK